MEILQRYSHLRHCVSEFKADQQLRSYSFYCLLINGILFNNKVNRMIRENSIQDNPYNQKHLNTTRTQTQEQKTQQYKDEDM